MVCSLYNRTTRIRFQVRQKLEVKVLIFDIVVTCYGDIALGRSAKGRTTQTSTHSTKGDGLNRTDSCNIGDRSFLPGRVPFTTSANISAARSYRKPSLHASSIFAIILYIYNAWSISFCAQPFNSLILLQRTFGGPKPF